MGTRALLALLWLLQHLPLAVQAPIGRAFGALLYRLAGSRRRIALRNLELCFPQISETQRQLLAREQRPCAQRGSFFYSAAEAARGAL